MIHPNKVVLDSTASGNFTVSCTGSNDPVNYHDELVDITLKSGYRNKAQLYFPSPEVTIDIAYSSRVASVRGVYNNRSPRSSSITLIIWVSRLQCTDAKKYMCEMTFPVGVSHTVSDSANLTLTGILTVRYGIANRAL